MDSMEQAGNWLHVWGGWVSGNAEPQLGNVIKF